MKLIYGLQTREATWSVTTGTALSDLDALNDPNPGERVRLQMAAPVDGVSRVRLEVTYPTGFYPIGACIRGVRADSDTWCALEYAAAGGGEAPPIGDNIDPDENHFLKLPGGDTGRMIVWDDLPSAPIGGVTHWYIDISAATSGAAPIIEIGSIILGAGIDVVIQSDWTLAGKQPGKISRTAGSQINAALRPGYRVLSCTPIYGDDDDARGAGLANPDGNTNWQDVAAALRADPWCVAIARIGTGDIPDPDVQTTAIYGIATQIPDVKHVAGPNYQPSQLTVEEVPG